MSGIPSIETIIQRQATLQATLPQASVIINGTRVFLTGNQSVDDAAMSAAAGITLEQFQQMKLQQTQFSRNKILSF